MRNFKPMTTSKGHVASLIIAALFAILLVAAWFPAAPDGENSRRLFAFKDITQVYKQEVVARKESATHQQTAARQDSSASREVARTTDAAPRQTSYATREEKSVEPTRQEKKVEGKNMDMNGLQIFFCISDIMLIGLAGAIWWNTWHIRQAMERLQQEAEEQTLETRQFNRTAEALENLVKTSVVEPVKPLRKKATSKNSTQTTVASGKRSDEKN
jgi:hypothetical protein